MKATAKLFRLLLSLYLAASAVAETIPANGKLKVFILAGQSNMVGFGQLDGSPGTMETYVKGNPKDYGQLVAKDGKRVVRDDVWIVNISDAQKPQQGWLTTGYGASEGHIGPEYGFGFVVGDAYEDPVLIIKSAWGGRSLFHNFLSPGSEEYANPEKDGDKGFQYAEVLRHVKEITGDLKKYYPDYAGKGFEITGFGWHQGWNDRINEKFNNEYESNMANFIRDIRKDLNAPALPFVIAESGMTGPEEKHPRALSLMKAQGAVAQHAEFKGNVAFVGTRAFWRSKEESPNGQGYHWNCNAETYYLIGEAMGEAMKRVIKEKK